MVRQIRQRDYLVLDYVDAQVATQLDAQLDTQDSCGAISRSVPCLVVSRLRERPRDSSGGQLDSPAPRLDTPAPQLDTPGARLRFHLHPLWSSALGPEQSAYLAALLSDWQDDTLNQDDLFDHLASLSVGPLRFSSSGNCDEDELVHVVDAELTRPPEDPSLL
jgi:hypothetical protein